jgi:hypothetical protein
VRSIATGFLARMRVYEQMLPVVSQWRHWVDIERDSRNAPGDVARTLLKDRLVALARQWASCHDVVDLEINLAYVLSLLEHKDQLGACGVLEALGPSDGLVLCERIVERQSPPAVTLFVVRFMLQHYAGLMAKERLLEVEELAWARRCCRACLRSSRMMPARSPVILGGWSSFC